ncbi:MAG: CRISPR-associated endonuclease Cas2 [Planctomycetes bacterium]|nr:CRISPR-associated endonuclease Cas2 [Planctomycetota bacterium]
MRFLIVYDIADDQRRSRIARILEGYGTRVQFSVFEFNLSPGRRVALMAELRSKDLLPGEPAGDSFTVYDLCERCYAETDRFGRVRLLDENVLVF